MELRLFAFLDYPEVFEESLKKNEVLDRHLKDVYVQSTDVSSK